MDDTVWLTHAFHVHSYNFKMCVNIKTLIMLWGNSADDKLVIFYIFSPENKIWLPQIISLGDN